MANTHTTAKKRTKTSTRNATTSNTTRRTSSSKARTAAHEREPKVIAVDSLYAVTGLGTDALRFTRALPDRLQAVATRDGLEGRLRARREEVEKRVRELRDRAEERFDTKASEGRTVVDDLVKRPGVRRFLDQASTARSQVEAAITSIRRTAGETVDAGVQAGRGRARTAKSQTKAAVTSVQRTAGAAVDAASELTS